MEMGQTRKPWDSALVYIILGGVGAFLFLAVGLYLMFKIAGNNQKNQQVIENQPVMVDTTPVAQTTSPTEQPPTPTPTQEQTPTPTPTVSTTPSTTPTPTDTIDETDMTKYEANYVYGTHRTDMYYIDTDQNAIVKTADSTVVYKAPDNYRLISFAVLDDGSVWWTGQIKGTNTYELRKVKPGQTGAGGLFWQYITTYTMRSFALNPANTKTDPVYILFDRPLTKQVYVLKIHEYKEAGKKLEKIEDYEAFEALYKQKDNDAVDIKYKDASNNVKIFTISFE